MSRIDEAVAKQHTLTHRDLNMPRGTHTIRENKYQ